MKTLKLFNAVLSKPTQEKNPYVSEQGYVIEPNALWAKNQIIDYYTRESLDGNDLNKTFHKSWKKIKNSSRWELLLDQILHYWSTYGSDFKDEVYIPNEKLNIPELKEGVTFKIIKAYTKEEMTEKCLSILKSGIALKEETIDDLLSLLTGELKYKFTGKEGIKNKECIVKLAELYGIFPNSSVEFFRYIIYRTTNQTLLIKNHNMVNMIKNGSYNPEKMFNQFGLDKLSEIFNRFKPLFLAFKNKCPKTINEISKLSKKNHKPLVSNPLNLVTQRELTEKDINWLDNATPFAIFKALSALHSRMNGQNVFAYRVRNGKSWTQEQESNFKISLQNNFYYLVNYLASKYDLSNLKFYIPENIVYALPTSEKMFVGNIPTGTKIFGKKLAVGVYWENSWGARDLDLSGLNIGGKIGWNSSYNQRNGSLMYSGDMTDASHGAVEYLYANNGLQDPTLVQNNVFSGDYTCEYKIIVGNGDNINRNYMMNPNNLLLETKCKSVQQQTILGMFIPEKDEQSFVLLNFGAGNVRVSGYSKNSDNATKALYQQWKDVFSFNVDYKILH